MEPLGVKRRLTCILAADAVGYSRMMGEDEAGTVRVLSAHRAVIDGIIAFHDGRIVGTAGDSVLAEFGSAVEAVRCAVEIQDALRTRNDALPEANRLLFRVGVNLGDVVVKGDDLLGDGVNVAARLESIAEPGGICIASSVYDQITGKLDLGFVDIGDQSLKNISRPVHVYRIGGAKPPVRPQAAGGGSRRALWASAAAAILVVLGAVGAWRFGWIGTERSSPGPEPAQAARESAKTVPPAVPVPPPDAAEQARRNADETQRRAVAEAELTRAKAEAEAAAVRAKAEAAAVRAKAEADAMRIRAESEAASVRAKAESDAGALRARTEAEQARRDVEAKSAPATSPAVAAAPPRSEATPGAAPTPPRPGGGAQLLAGKWTVTRSCAPYQELPAWSESFPLTVDGGNVVVERGQPGRPGYLLISGRVADDGQLVLAGSGVSGSKAAFGRQLYARFAGRVDASQFSLTGRYGARDCTLTFTAVH